MSDSALPSKKRVRFAAGTRDNVRTTTSSIKHPFHNALMNDRMKERKHRIVLGKPVKIDADADDLEGGSSTSFLPDTPKENLGSRLVPTVKWRQPQLLRIVSLNWVFSLYQRNQRNQRNQSTNQSIYVIIQPRIVNLLICLFFCFFLFCQFIFFAFVCFRATQEHQIAEVRSEEVTNQRNREERQRAFVSSNGMIPSSPSEPTELEIKFDNLKHVNTVEILFTVREVAKQVWLTVDCVHFNIAE
jgi:hypothetical protein